MRAVLIDDEQLVLDNLRFLLHQFESLEILQASTEPLQALETIRKERPDLVFLDVSMPEMNGIEIAEQIRLCSPYTKIVFITAYDQYAVEAFRVKATDYVLKPVTSQKLQQVFANLGLAEASSKPQPKGPSKLRIVGHLNNQFFLIAPEKAVYIQVLQRDLVLVSLKERYTLDHNMAYWEKLLEPYGWFRCHKSFLVNLSAVESGYPMFNSTYNVKLKNCSDTIPVSRTYIKAFREHLGL